MCTCRPPRLPEAGGLPEGVCRGVSEGLPEVLAEGLPDERALVCGAELEEGAESAPPLVLAA